MNDSDRSQLVWEIQVAEDSSHIHKLKIVVEESADSLVVAVVVAEENTAPSSIHKERVEWCL